MQGSLKKMYFLVAQVWFIVCLIQSHLLQWENLSASTNHHNAPFEYLFVSRKTNCGIKIFRGLSGNIQDLEHGVHNKDICEGLE